MRRNQSIECKKLIFLLLSSTLENCRARPDPCAVLKLLCLVLSLFSLFDTAGNVKLQTFVVVVTTMGVVCGNNHGKVEEAHFFPTVVVNATSHILFCVCPFRGHESGFRLGQFNHITYNAKATIRGRPQSDIRNLNPR